MHLLAHNLESFNPAFAACVLQVQLSIGSTDYEKRDAALKLLIRPLAGEYGMRSDETLRRSRARRTASSSSPFTRTS